MIFFLCLIVALMLFLWWWLQPQRQPIVFLDAAATINILKQVSAYTSSFTVEDIRRRGTIAKPTEWTLSEQHSILDAYTKIGATEHYKVAKSPVGLDWNYPHTRDDVIFLPGTVDAITLHHEMIHVIQRRYPQRFRNLYAEWGFNPISSDVIPTHIIENVRANPDLFGAIERWWIWRGKWIPLAIWTTGNNIKIMLYDVQLCEMVSPDETPYSDYFRGVHDAEHPNEIAAYMLSNMKNFDQTPATLVLNQHLNHVGNV